MRLGRNDVSDRIVQSFSQRSKAMTPACRGVVVIVPALNEEEAIVRVLNDLPWEELRAVIVVDNGSTDATAEVAKEAGAVLAHEPERGYGAAVQRGLATLEAEFHDTPIVAFIDADYSDYPDDLPQLIHPIQEGEADFVLGSRLLTNPPDVLPKASYWGNRLACGLMRLFWGIRYSDLGPFRAIRTESLRQLRMRDRNYGWTVEMQIKAARAGLRIREVGVRYRKRIGQSKISGTFCGVVCAGGKILYTIARYRLVSLNFKR